MKTLKAILCGAAAFLATSAALAAVPSSVTQFTPNMMNYQGHLYDAANYSDYMEGTYNIQCRIYASETGGTPLWGGRYSVYVKGGYFNIMLGDTSGSDISGTTYKNNQLWKALWENNNLWLGVTVEQDYMNNPVSSPREITPRQRLLAGPYAFRAQAAQYANASYGDFTVGGSLLLGSTWTLGSRLKYDGTTLTLGVTDGSTPTADSPSVDVKAKSISANANGGIELKSNNGDIALKTGTAKKITLDAGGVVLNGAGAVSMTSALAAGISAPIVSLTGATVMGEGTPMWKSTKGNSVALFKLKKVSVTIPTSTTMGSARINESGDINYAWMVVGYNTAGAAPREIGCVQDGDSTWSINVTLPARPSTATTFHVDLLGINNACVNDIR